MAAYKSSSTWVPISRRSLANTAIMSMGALGIVVSTEPTEYLVGLIGWRQTFAVFATLILAAALEDVEVTRPGQAHLELVEAIARPAGVRVAIDQPGEQHASDFHDRRPGRFAPQRGVRAHGSDALATDRYRRVRQHLDRGHLLAAARAPRPAARHYLPRSREDQVAQSAASRIGSRMP